MVQRELFLGNKFQDDESSVLMLMSTLKLLVCLACLGLLESMRLHNCHCPKLEWCAV